MEPIFQRGQFSPSGEWTAVKWEPEMWEETTGLISEEMKVCLCFWCIDVEVYCFLKLFLESSGCEEWFLHSYLYVHRSIKIHKKESHQAWFKTKFRLSACSTSNLTQRAIGKDFFVHFCLILKHVIYSCLKGKIHHQL